jgi:hypothetical protein
VLRLRVRRQSLPKRDELPAILHERRDMRSDDRSSVRADDAGESGEGLRDAEKCDSNVPERQHLPDGRSLLLYLQRADLPRGQQVPESLRDQHGLPDEPG